MLTTASECVSLCVWLLPLSYNVQPQRERLVETMFETFGVPALYMTKGAVLCAFAAGRATALVIDLGGGMTYVTPVHDGYALYRGVSVCVCVVARA